jgi:putative peptide zinc metalloprotease protein
LRRGISNKPPRSKNCSRVWRAHAPIHAEERRLLAAPFDGAWVDVPDDIRADTWVGSKQVLAD